MNTARNCARLRLLSGKLTPVLVVFLTVAILSLFVTYVGLAVQSTMRAIVNGEALWSKAQKDAVFYVVEYAETSDPTYYRELQDALTVIVGDRRARLELRKPDYDYDTVLQGFLTGGNHPDDVPGVIRLLRCCGNFWHIARALNLWERADKQVLELQQLGTELDTELTSSHPSRKRLANIRRQAQLVGISLRPLEIAFSETLGEAARWLNSVLLWAIAGIVAGLILLGMYASARIIKKIWQSETKYRALLDTANDALIVVDEQSGAVLASNRRAEELLGISADKMAETNLLDLYPQARRTIAQLAHAAEQISASKDAVRLDVKHCDGRQVPAEVSTSSTLWDGRKVNLAIVRDISERLRVEEGLRIAANALAHIAEGVMITDNRTRIVSVNQAFTAITGYEPTEIIGKRLALLQSDRHPPDFYRKLWETVKATGQWRGEVWSRRCNSEVYPAMLSISTVLDDHDAVTHYVGVFNDISQYKSYEQRLQHLAHHDALTQLPNRIYFEDQVRTVLYLARERDHKATIALVFIDLDGFKAVNDRYGHAAGDELLTSVANRIKGCVRQSDAVARVGGDEFTILLDELTDVNDAVLIAEKLLDAISQPVIYGSHQLCAFASIGISCYPRDGEDVQTLLNNADAAMYEAKQESRNAYRLFSPSLKAKASAKLELGNALHQAYQRQEFSLVYQPCVDLVTGEITSVEALIRWLHPEQGNIPPATFIPLAEDIGLIKPITEWVLHTACQQAAVWHGEGLPPLRLAVNISARHFRDRDLTRSISAILGATGWRASWLNLEITERVMMRTDEEVEGLLAELHEMGITISVDDFGTGYSSLSYLKNFLIDYLKIDRSFISGIPSNAHDVTIAKTIIAMANSLKIRIIAEGIETEQQHHFLRTEGCQEGQGYLFSKPLPAHEMSALLRRCRGGVIQHQFPRFRAMESSKQTATRPS